MKHSSSFLFTLTLCCLVSASCSSANLFSDEDKPGFVVSDIPYNNEYRSQTKKYGVTPPTAKYGAHAISQKRLDELFGNSNLLRKQVADYTAKEKASMGDDGGDRGGDDGVSKAMWSMVRFAIRLVLRV